MAKSSYKEPKETPGMEAKSHSKGFLRKALKLAPKAVTRMAAKMKKGY